MNTSPGVIALSHNIPRSVDVDSSTMCAVRIQNILYRPLYFRSHNSFYGHAVNETRFHLSIRVNGALVKPLLVENDCLAPRERVTLYFPFHAADEGDYSLQVVIADEHADPVSRDGSVLLE